MKISESPYGLSETYIVKFWYVNSERWLRQGEEEFYCNSKSAHDKIEKYAKKYLDKFYQEVSIINVTYV